MKAKDYAEAIFQASKGKSDEELDKIVSNTKKLLEKNGHVALLPHVVRELEKITKKRGRVDEVVVVLSDKNDFEKYSERINEDIEKLNATNLPRKIVEDKTLVGGYQLYANGIRLDKTYKKTLLSMYTKLINSNI
jgi:F0F1-type ATP synthase delta subunit